MYDPKPALIGVILHNEHVCAYVAISNANCLPNTGANEYMYGSWRPYITATRCSLPLAVVGVRWKTGMNSLGGIPATRRSMFGRSTY